MPVLRSEAAPRLERAKRAGADAKARATEARSLVAQAASLSTMATHQVRL